VHKVHQLARGLERSKLVWQIGFSLWGFRKQSLRRDPTQPAEFANFNASPPASPSPSGFDTNQLPRKFKPTMAKIKTAANWLNVSDQLSVPRSFPFLSFPLLAISGSARLSSLTKPPSALISLCVDSQIISAMSLLVLAIFLRISSATAYWIYESLNVTQWQWQSCATSPTPDFYA
jgi:hypothetical protein